MQQLPVSKAQDMISPRCKRGLYAVELSYCSFVCCLTRVFVGHWPDWRSSAIVLAAVSGRSAAGPVSPIFSDILMATGSRDQDTESGTLFHFPQHCRIGRFRKFIRISHKSPTAFYETRRNDGHRQANESSTFCERSADIWIRIRVTFG